MRSFTVDNSLSGEHVVKACTVNFPSLTKADLYKALKHKDIRIDGKKVSSDIKVLAGQEVQVWLPDALFEGEAASPRKASDDYTVVAQTDGLLIVNKRQGLAVHSGKTASTNLIDIVRETTGNKNAELVHRIDMNTKRYRCIVVGKIPKDLGEPVICDDEALMSEVSAYLEKTPSGQVYIHDTKQEGDLPITTRYRVLGYYGGLSEIECELVTGRTHQIRAQFAHLGYPILGDGNYGRNQVNLAFRAKDGGRIRHQQLWSTTLMFGKISGDNRHRELSGRRFSIEPRYEVDL